MGANRINGTIDGVAPAALAPNIVRATLDRICSLCPSIPAELALAVERQILSEWGGQHLGYLCKTVERKPGRPPIDAATRREALREVLTDAPTATILKRQGISRASLYRMMKKGPP